MIARMSRSPKPVRLDAAQELSAKLLFSCGLRILPNRLRADHRAKKNSSGPGDRSLNKAAVNGPP